MPQENAHHFEPKNITTQDMYKLMTGSVVPRPIAWVSSQHEDGTRNIAPFSFFTVASRQPPTLLISIGPGTQNREGTVKDTLENIRSVNEFVINIVPFHHADEMYTTSLPYDQDIDEFAKSGLTAARSKLVSPPSILEAPVAFECTCTQIIPVGTDHVILGEVIHTSIDTAVYKGNYKINYDHFEPIARMLVTIAD
ncbi:flavin reductase family protein [Geomicrobium sp. JCM 19039]|uniref:flavin reductase family protein n=1 Tax=Geomicrobium sp. JCM 19039 TaxID=1460636 RepID=UPI00045F4434|nr:flavin reductase family protein [Geomicrobium sp. JCM 19039]GAK11036.1 hypothetical protein JCM19039_708 [Geomicrobium sp. JCM 19039]